MISHISETAVSDDSDHLVVAVLSSLTKDAVSFERATKLYNSDFFRTESLETKIKLCTALADFYGPQFSNSFWNANRQPGA